jgi:hypothetical protein
MRIVEYNSDVSKGYFPKESKPEVTQPGDSQHKVPVQ